MLTIKKRNHFFFTFRQSVCLNTTEFGWEGFWDGEICLFFAYLFKQFLAKRMSLYAAYMENVVITSLPSYYWYPFAVLRLISLWPLWLVWTFHPNTWFPLLMVAQRIRQPGNQMRHPRLYSSPNSSTEAWRRRNARPLTLNSWSASNSSPVSHLNQLHHLTPSLLLPTSRVGYLFFIIYAIAWPNNFCRFGSKLLHLWLEFSL